MDVKIKFLPFNSLCIYDCIRHVLHKYANEDVSLGAWFIGLDVEHIDDRRLCCGTPPGEVFIFVLNYIVYLSANDRNTSLFIWLRYYEKY